MKATRLNLKDGAACASFNCLRGGAVCRKVQHHSLMLPLGVLERRKDAVLNRVLPSPKTFSPGLLMNTV